VIGIFEEKNYELWLGDCVEEIKNIPDNTIDLTVTSPPYDNLRTYNGNIKHWSFEKFKEIAKELYRVTKDGGVVVWIVGDATVNGSETGTSFRQALWFKECGFNLHDTMIWNKNGFSAVGALATRYAPVFEYMFILSKGKIKTFNPIKDKPNKWAGTKNHGTIRIDGDNRRPVSNNKVIQEYGQRYNIWDISPVRQKGDNKHPAPFPEQLASDHIISWSNEGDIVLDCFMGSGTTGISALNNGRKFIGIEIDENYFNMSKSRMA
jgi:site-specific DNA-methyltransferase (adenine-specific)